MADKPRRKFRASSEPKTGKPIKIKSKHALPKPGVKTSGGDGYPKLVAHKSFVDTGFVDADLLRAYIAGRSPLRVADFAPGDAVIRRPAGK